MGWKSEAPSVSKRFEPLSLGDAHLLLVEDIKSVCRCAQNGNTHRHNDASDDRLGEVKGCRVDLHLGCVFCSSSKNASS